MANGNPFYVEPAAGGILKGLDSALQGVGAFKSRQAQTKRQQEKERLVDAIANKEPNAVFNLLKKDPKLAEQAMKVSGFKDKASQRNYVDMLTKIKSGYDKETAIAERAAYVKERGGDPRDTLTLATLQPEQFDKAVDMGMALNATDEEWKRIKDVQGIIDPAKTRELDIKQETLDIRRLETDQRNLDRQLGRETNALKREELEQKIADKKVIAGEKKNNLENARAARFSEASNMVSTIDNIVADGTFASAYGRAVSKTPEYLRTQDAIDARSKINQVVGLISLESRNKLKGQGTISDSESVMLAKSATMLDNDLISPELAQKELRRVQKIFKSAAEKNKPKETEAQPAVEASAQYTEGQTASHPSTGEIVVFTNGQWQPAP